MRQLLQCISTSIVANSFHCVSNLLKHQLGFCSFPFQLLTCVSNYVRKSIIRAQVYEYERQSTAKPAFSFSSVSFSNVRYWKASSPSSVGSVPRMRSNCRFKAINALAEYSARVANVSLVSSNWASNSGILPSSPEIDSDGAQYWKYLR
jgi:hypothetical protein